MLTMQHNEFCLNDDKSSENIQEIKYRLIKLIAREVISCNFNINVRGILFTISIKCDRYNFPHLAYMKLAFKSLAMVALITATLNVS